MPVFQPTGPVAEASLRVDTQSGAQKMESKMRENKNSQNIARALNYSPEFGLCKKSEFGGCNSLRALSFRFAQKGTAGRLSKLNSTEDTLFGLKCPFRVQAVGYCCKQVDASGLFRSWQTVPRFNRWSESIRRLWISTHAMVYETRLSARKV